MKKQDVPFSKTDEQFFLDWECAVFVFVCFIPSYYLLISLVALFLKQSGVVPCTPSCCSTSILVLAYYIRNRGTSS